MVDFVPPKDKYNLIYMVFVAHGVGFLLPWNMFINAVDYFLHYKFSTRRLGKAFAPANRFMQVVTFSSQVPNVIFNWVNVFIQIKGGLELRIIFSIAIMIVMFLITITLAMMDTTSWVSAFYYLTMVIVCVLCAANAIYQNCIFGMAAKLPFTYTGAIILGNNVCGTFTSVTDILSKLGTTNLRIAAVYYFIAAILVLLFCVDSIYMLKINRYYNYQDQYQTKIEHENRVGDEKQSQKIPYFYILKKASPQLLNAFLALFSAITVYPSVTSAIKPMTKSPLGRLFTSLTCFLTFNVCAMIGSSLAAFKQWPKPKYVWICNVVRLVVIPLTLLCNYQPGGRRSPVLFKSDTVHWLINVFNGLSAGYFTSVTMMYVTTTVEPNYAPIAGMYGSAFLISGIFSGILVSFIWPEII